MRNSIVIPCYNEAERLDTQRFQDFATKNTDYILCFVNDGSSDNTAEVLAKMSAAVSNIQFVDLKENGGKAEAVRAGVQAMLELNTVENVGFIDADLSTDFEDYTRLVNILDDEQLDMVFGSRKMEEDNEEIERTFFRKLASAFFSFFIQWITGMPIKDTQCGSKVFSRSAAKYAYRTAFISRWLFDVEIFIKMKRRYGKGNVMNHLKEVQLNQWVEMEGSKITSFDSIKLPIQLLGIAINYNFSYQLRAMNAGMSSAMIRLSRVATSLGLIIGLTKI